VDRLQVGWRDADYTKLQYNPVGTLLYQYDPEGNIVRRTAADQSYTVYTWDHRNRLIAVTDFDDSDTELTRVEYHYDAFDQLVGRKVFLSGGSTADESEVFVYEDGQVVLQFDGSGNDDLLAEDLSHRYLWGPMVDQILAEETVNNLTDAGQNEVLWPLADHLGTVRDRVDSSGTVVEHADYDAFGRRLDAPAVDAVFGWTGRYRDPLTGLQYNTARWYNPETGRWMSEDPIGFAAGDANLNRYVDNQASSLTDPEGTSPYTKEGRKIALRNAYKLFKKRLKNLVETGMVQVHHVILQDLFKDPKLGPFLKKLGVLKHDLCNTIPLPTVNGRILKGIGKRALHQGMHLSDYVASITKRLLSIEARHSAGKLTDEAALAAVRAIQKEAKKGLRNGSIKLINEEKAVEKALQASAVLAAIAAMGNQDEFKKLMEEAGDHLLAQVETLAKKRPMALACVKTYTGDAGLAGWLGEGADFFNPAADVAAVAELEYIIHVLSGGNPYGETPSDYAARRHWEVTGENPYKFKP